MSQDQSTRERNRAALNSVVAALFLTCLKILVGVMSGSLGILAEAAHSGLDLAAAIVTLIAVRAATKPADPGHAYGHGKIENLAALLETLLLLVTCGWIISKSIQRLLAGQVHVDASVWAFAVMAISIVVDYSRSRMLYRVAAEHRSQALEADALHFSTDIGSSAVVIVGLAGVKAAQWWPSLGFLQHADAVAALFVASMVLFVSGRLGLRTFQALIDASPAGAAEQIRERVEKMSQIIDCHAVRVRHAGPYTFIDLHITLDRDMPLHLAHDLTEQVEAVVSDFMPGADVIVHPEPSPPSAPPQTPL